MTEDDFTIQPARAEDAAAIHHVYKRSIHVLGRSAYTEAELESWAYGQTEDLYRKAIGQLAHFEVTQDAGGFIIAFAATRQDEVWLLYTDPDWAGKGVGGALLRHAEQHLLDARHPTIWVQSSLNAQPFYVRHGYVAEEVIDYESRGGVVLKVVKMTKTLA